MANLVTDSTGKPSPQYLSEDGIRYEYQQGKNGAMNINLKGIDPKQASDTSVTNVLPIQVIDNKGGIVSEFTNTIDKSNIVLFSLESSTGEKISNVIDSKNKSNITIVIYKTMGESNIGTVTIEGLYGSSYLPILINSDISIPINETEIISITEKQMVLPNSLRVKVNTAENITYAVYATLS